MMDGKKRLGISVLFVLILGVGLSLLTVLYAQENEKGWTEGNVIYGYVEPGIDTFRAGFREGEKSEIKNISLEEYIKEYLRYDLQVSMYLSILHRDQVKLSMRRGFLFFTPFLKDYKNLKEINFLDKKGKISYIAKEGVGWFFESYLLYLGNAGRGKEMKELFEEYKNYIESRLFRKGIFLSITPHKYLGYRVMEFNLSNNNITKEEKTKIADEIAKLTAEFMYEKITNDSRFSYLKEMFEDYLREHDKKSKEGFRVYKYSTRTPWGDEYTVVATVEPLDRDEIELGVVSLLNGEMIGWNSYKYKLEDITNGKVYRMSARVDKDFVFPLRVGFIEQRLPNVPNVMRVVTVLKHDCCEERLKMVITSLKKLERSVIVPYSTEDYILPN